MVRRFYHKPFMNKNPQYYKVSRGLRIFWSSLKTIFCCWRFGTIFLAGSGLSRTREAGGQLSRRWLPLFCFCECHHFFVITTFLWFPPFLWSSPFLSERHKKTNPFHNHPGKSSRGFGQKCHPRCREQSNRVFWSPLHLRLSSKCITWLAPHHVVLWTNKQYCLVAYEVTL